MPRPSRPPAARPKSTKPARRPVRGPRRPPQRGEEQRERDNLQRIAGEAAVAAVFATAPERVQRLFFEDRLKQATGPWCLKLAQARRPYRVVAAEELARVAGTAMHGGVVALVEPRVVQPFDVRLAAQWAAAGKPLLLLDGVSNPHNFGAIVRTAAFFGIPRLIVSDHPGQALPSDASHRVAEGGFEYLEVYRAANFAPTLRELKRWFRVLGASAHGGKPMAALRRDNRPDALILGNEEQGLPAATLAACDALVTIPGSGKMQSLNVAASAAILLHALATAARPK